MSASAISRRYAKALLSLADEQGQVEQYSADLDRVCAVMAAEEMLRLLLTSPSFPMAKKKAMLEEVMDKLDLLAMVRNFLGLLLEKDRLKYLGQISENFRAFADELSGVVRARINTAVPMEETQVESIRDELAKQTGKQVEVTVDVEPALIGGIQAEIGGTLFDGSLRTQLKRIADTLQKG